MRTVRATDAKTHLLNILDEVSRTHECYQVIRKGVPEAVLMSVQEYEELLEDLHDLAVIAERRDEPTVSFEELKNKLKADGLL